MFSQPSIRSDLIQQQERALQRRAADAERTASRQTSNASAELCSLVRAAQAGDQRAWEALVPRLSPILRTVARDYRLSAADVDDMVQATWVAAFSHIAQLREPEAITGWLCVTARRQALRIVRARRLEIPVDDLQPADETAQPRFESALVREEEHREVHAAIDRLPDRQRALLTALLNAETSYADVSTKLKMPYGSIGPTRERALNRLRRDRRLTSALLGAPSASTSSAAPSPGS